MGKVAVYRPEYLVKEFDKPLYLGSYFGFVPIDAPRISEGDRKLVSDCEDENKTTFSLYRPLEKAAFLRTYVEKEFVNLPHPLMLSYKKNETVKREPDYFFHVVGNPMGLSEAILIRTIISILSEIGHKNLIVNINSIGDKDSILSYERELHHYAKKVYGELSDETKQTIKKDIFNLVSACRNEKPEIKEALPPSMASLTSASRNHFKEVLEHLEQLGIEFRILSDLVGNRHFVSHSIFTISNNENTEIPLAAGYRYSKLSKRFGMRKELPCAGATIFGILKKDNGSKKLYKDLPKPKFYLVQLGEEAKMKCLSLIEMLRQNHIPVYHYLGKDKITAQLGNAENLRVPYLLIMGRKEALENTITIRNQNTRAQDTIRISDLPQYIKHINL